MIQKCDRTACVFRHLEEWTIDSSMKTDFNAIFPFPILSKNAL